MRFFTAGALGTAALALGLGSVAVGVWSVQDGTPAPGPVALAPVDQDASPTSLTPPVGAPVVADGPAGTATTIDPGDPEEIRDRFSATPSPRPEGDTGPIGGVDPSGAVPEGLDLTAFPPVEGGGHVPAGPGGRPGSLSAGSGCAYQCIESGVAYPRGFGAELVVETEVPADLFLSVIADADEDGDWEFSEFRWSAGAVTNQSWAFDGLAPGQTYYVMVAATDEHDDVSYAWGEFTTLSQRSVSVAVSRYEVVGGPGNVESTTQRIALDGGETAAYELGDWVDLDDTDRTLDVELLVIRGWEASDPCEAHWPTLFEVPQGDDDTSCVAWNTAVGSIDLDAVPASGSHWASHRFDAVLHTPTGAGNALPTGYGDPRHFHVEALLEVVVTYR